MVAAVRAMNNIKNLKLLTLGTAMQLFRLKVEPTLTYGLEFIWEYLMCKQLLELEKMKASYMKRVLAVSQHTRSRLVYELAKETFFVEDLKTFLMLPTMMAYKDALRELNDKKKDLWEDFYMTEVMTNWKWTETNYQLRHVINRIAVHGFHFRLCSKATFHEPSDECRCKLCSGLCARYHVTECTARTCSMTELATE
jgi:hypothetical protein